MSLFGVDFAKELNDALGGEMLSLTLGVIKYAGRTTSSGGRTSTTTNRTGRGMLGGFKVDQMEGSLVRKDDRMVLIMADSLQSSAVPEPGNTIKNEGSTYNIIRVWRDPDGAIYNCHVRGA